MISPDVASPNPSKAAPRSRPTFWEAFRFWLKLGFISFGGPAGQIAIMQRELVERRRWIGQSRFLHALNYCMLLPGPEATQLAIYVGWLMHRTAGGVVAGVLFVLPSVFILWGLSFVYVTLGSTPLIAGAFYGLKPAVMAIVLAAVLRIGRKALKNWMMWLLAALAFTAIFFLHAPFPFIVFGAGAIGLVGARFFPGRFGSTFGNGNDGAEDGEHFPDHAKPSWKRAIRVTIICLALWWIPVWLVGGTLGKNDAVFGEGVFFGKAAVVTFGGAYAVLPYVAQRSVEQFHWLTTDQMLDGLGLAETTPGPLIMVLQFVGFMGGWNHPGALPPLAAATLGALLTTWVTFTPCFLWIFLGGPHVERLRSNTKLAGALSSITAAVVGVILNLAVWFGVRVLHPAVGGFDWFALGIALLAFVGLTRWNWNVVPVVLGGAAIGMIRTFAG